MYDPEGNLVMYQGRYFGDNPQYPKYVTKGPVVGTFDIHWCLDGDSKSIVVVEDFISAIKVSRVMNSIPMWGSSFSKAQLKVLSQTFSKLVWWVDPDKQADYPKLVNKVSLYFDEVKCVYSDLDPKYYEKEEVCLFLI